MTDAKRGAAGRLWLPISLSVLTVSLVLVGIVFLVRGHTLRNSGAVTNEAVVNHATTSQVVGQVSTALSQVLSYDYQKPQVAKRAAAHWLAGDAPKQYELLFSELQKLAPGQKLTLVARVVNAGVTSLKGAAAQLLVFLDQESTRASDKRSSVSAAQVQITARKKGQLWQIVELKPL